MSVPAPSTPVRSRRNLQEQVSLDLAKQSRPRRSVTGETHLDVLDEPKRKRLNHDSVAHISEVHATATVSHTKEGISNHESIKHEPAAEVRVEFEMEGEVYCAIGEKALKMLQLPMMLPSANCTQRNKSLFQQCGTHQRHSPTDFLNAKRLTYVENCRPCVSAKSMVPAVFPPSAIHRAQHSVIENTALPTDVAAPASAAWLDALSKVAEVPGPSLAEEMWSCPAAYRVKVKRSADAFLRTQQSQRDLKVCTRAAAPTVLKELSTNLASRAAYRKAARRPDVQRAWDTAKENINTTVTPSEKITNSWEQVVADESMPCGPSLAEELNDGSIHKMQKVVGRA